MEPQQHANNLQINVPGGVKEAGFPCGGLDHHPGYCSDHNQSGLGWSVPSLAPGAAGSSGGKVFGKGGNLSHLSAPPHLPQEGISLVKGTCLL